MTDAGESIGANEPAGLERGFGAASLQYWQPPVLPERGPNHVAVFRILYG